MGGVQLFAGRLFRSYHYTPTAKSGVMNYFILSFILHFSIFIPAVSAAVKYQRIEKEFHPFIWILWVGACNEVLSLVLIVKYGSNTVSSNVYVLVEAILFLYLFCKWESCTRRKIRLFFLLVLGVWIADNLILNTLFRNNSFFRVFYSFLILFLSIGTVNKIVIFDKSVLWKSGKFILSVIFIFYFTCRTFVETFNAVKVGFNFPFLQNLWMLLAFVNFISNILYFLVILWIPKKRTSISQSF